MFAAPLTSDRPVARLPVPQSSLTSAPLSHAAGEAHSRSSRQQPSQPAASTSATLAVSVAAAALSRSQRVLGSVRCAADRHWQMRLGRAGHRIARPALRNLYPSGKLLSSGTLEVSDGFELYYEEYGAEDGVPAVFLHGGPGAGFTQNMGRLFDLKRYRVVLFHQRGCKKSLRKDDSTAGGQLEGNTTWHLVEDLEALRAHLGFDKWVVGGGSWGSCLAVAYATRHPERVTAVVMRAAFLFRAAELEHFCGPRGRARTCHAAAWRSFTDWLPWAEEASAHTIAAAYRRAALGEDAALSPENAVRKWKAWEMTLFTSSAPEDAELPGPADGEEIPLPSAETPTEPFPKLSAASSAQAMLTIHYVAERGFLLEGLDLLEAAKDLEMPVKIVHGSGDSICLAQTAKELAEAAPKGELLLTSAGHSQWDGANVHSFVKATDDVLESILVSS